MTDSNKVDGPANHEDRIREAWLDTPRESLFSYWFSGFWFNVSLGIAIFASLWPLCILLVILPFTAQTIPIRPSEILATILGGFIVVVFSGTIVFCLFPFIGILVAAFFIGPMSWVGSDTRTKPFAVTVGGLVGLLASLTVLITAYQESTLIAQFLFLGTGTILCQIGAVVGAEHEFEFYERIGLERKTSCSSIRFRLSQAFVVITLVAISLALLKLANLLNRDILSLIGFWLVIQLVAFIKVIRSNINR